MARPEDIKYTASHEWVRVEGDTAVVGITDHAVEQLGDLAFVDLPKKGAQVEKGSPFGEIESTKSVSELFAPLSGEIVEVHDDLVENLLLITTSPFAEGWMVRIRMSEPSEVDTLLSAADYAAHLRTEEH
ncbi:MAG TPA: glycine cleavage system protein GcvH [Planctomycetota bacterium]|nr:glycine cleavage system protein GcvH [Planctomycetota bacterium]